MRRVALLLAILAAASVHAQTTRCSPNGRSCTTFHYIDDEDGGHPAERITDANGRVIRDLEIACIDAFVTNDARYLVCAPHWLYNARLEVYRVDDGARVVQKPVTDFFTVNDFHEVSTAPAEWTLREDGGSVQVVFPMPSSFDGKQHVDIVIDALTGELLTPKHDIFPPRFVEIREPGEPRPWAKTVCIGKTLAFDTALGQWKFRKLWKVDPTRLLQSTFSFRFTL